MDDNVACQYLRIDMSMMDDYVVCYYASVIIDHDRRRSRLPSAPLDMEYEDSSIEI